MADQLLFRADVALGDGGRNEAAPTDDGSPATRCGGAPPPAAPSFFIPSPDAVEDGAHNIVFPTVPPATARPPAEDEPSVLAVSIGETIDGEDSPSPRWKSVLAGPASKAVIAEKEFLAAETLAGARSGDNTPLRTFGDLLRTTPPAGDLHLTPPGEAGAAPSLGAGRGGRGDASDAGEAGPLADVLGDVGAEGRVVPRNGASR